MSQNKVKKKKKLSEEEMEERLEKVEYGLLHGISCIAIAEKLGVSKRQIERYRKTIRKNNLELFKQSSPEDRLADLHADIRVIRNQALKIASSAKADRNKISALSLLQRQTDSKFNQYKDLGYIDVLPQKVEITGKLTVQQIIQIGRDLKKENEKKGK